MIRSTRSKSRSKVARLRSIHSRRSITAGVSRAVGSCGADLLGNDRLDAQQLVAVEGLGRLARLRAEARVIGAQPAAGDAAHRFPVDEPGAGAAHDLALGDGGAHRQQAADDDAHAETAGVACHARQSLVRRPRSAASTSGKRARRTPRSATALKAATSPVVAIRLARRQRLGGSAGLRAPSASSRSSAARAVVNAESTTATPGPTCRSITGRSSG